MKLILHNRIKRMLIVFLLLWIVMICLSKLGRFDGWVSYDCLFGNTVLGVRYMQLAFLLNVFLCCLFHGDLILYQFHNQDMLYPRYGTKYRGYHLLLRQIFVGNVLYLALAFAAMLLTLVVFGDRSILTWDARLLQSIVGCYGKCQAFAMLNILLIMKLGETKAFAGVIAAALIFIFLQGAWPYGLVAELGMAGILLLCAIYIGVCLLLYGVTRAALDKERKKYANRIKSGI